MCVYHFSTLIWCGAHSFLSYEIWPTYVTAYRLNMSYEFIKLLLYSHITVNSVIVDTQVTGLHRFVINNTTCTIVKHMLIDNGQP